MASILLVDDEDFILRMHRLILRWGGYEVISASNGLEALEILAERPVDLIISDLMMPGMDGYTLAKTVHQNSGHAQIPFVLLTASLEAIEKDYPGIGEIVNLLIAKPISSQELTEVVSNLLSPDNK